MIRAIKWVYQNDQKVKLFYGNQILIFFTVKAYNSCNQNYFTFEINLIHFVALSLVQITNLQCNLTLTGYIKRRKGDDLAFCSQ